MECFPASSLCFFHIDLNLWWIFQLTLAQKQTGSSSSWRWLNLWWHCPQILLRNICFCSVRSKNFLSCFQANKTHIELNTKNVYKADGYAVKEMLKVTSLLHSAMKTTKTALGDGIKEDNVKSKFNVAPQVTQTQWLLTSHSENKWFIINSLRIKRLSFESQNFRGQMK